jgi:spermidine synthase
MTAKQVRPPFGKISLGFALLALALAALVVGLGLTRDPSQSAAQGVYQRGELEYDVKTAYSRIRVRKVDNVRTLWFVRDSGEEVVESQVDLDRPHDLLIDYTRYMFLSYLFRPKPEKVLIVGLGGGAMVHFLRHHDPAVKVEVVEIDPAVVKIADKYFGVRNGDDVKVVTADGIDHIKNTDERFDVIYMDAFLKPSRDTDETGVPLRLKTIEFYKEVQKKLTRDGLVVFNINPHARIDDDVRNIKDAFPQTYVFRLPRFEGLVVVGSMAEERMTPGTMVGRAADMDRRFKASYSFREMVRRQFP